MQTVTLSEFCCIVKKVSKESKGKLSLGYMGENHGTCEDTGMQYGGIPRYMGNGMYEKCGSELERPYLPPKGKDDVYKLGEVTVMVGGSRRGTVKENLMHGLMRKKRAKPSNLLHVENAPGQPYSRKANR